MTNFRHLSVAVAPATSDKNANIDAYVAKIGELLQPRYKVHYCSSSEAVIETNAKIVIIVAEHDHANLVLNDLQLFPPGSGRQVLIVWMNRKPIHLPPLDEVHSVTMRDIDLQTNYPALIANVDALEVNIPRRDFTKWLTIAVIPILGIIATLLVPFVEQILNRPDSERVSPTTLPRATVSLPVPTGGTLSGAVLRGPSSFTLYVDTVSTDTTDSSPVFLSAFDLVAGDRRLPLIDYFPSLWDQEILAPDACLQFTLEGETPVLPNECEPSMTFTHVMAAGNVFWRDFDTNRPLDVSLQWEKRLVAFCASQRPRCEIEFQYYPE